MISPNPVIFDIGANIEISTLFFLHEYQGSTVYAYEPAHQIFSVLKTNLESYTSRARCFQLALGKNIGEARIGFCPEVTAMSELYVDPEDDEKVTREFLKNSGIKQSDIEDLVCGRYGVNYEKCRVSTLSTEIQRLNIKRIDLVKINVEKAELDVFDGIDNCDWNKIL